MDRATIISDDWKGRRRKVKKSMTKRAKEEDQSRLVVLYIEKGKEKEKWRMATAPQVPGTSPIIPQGPCQRYAHASLSYTYFYVPKHEAHTLPKLYRFHHRFVLSTVVTRDS